MLKRPTALLLCASLFVAACVALGRAQGGQIVIRGKLGATDALVREAVKAVTNAAQTL